MVFGVKHIFPILGSSFHQALLVLQTQSDFGKTALKKHKLNKTHTFSLLRVLSAVPRDRKPSLITLLKNASSVAVKGMKLNDNKHGP